MSEHARTPRVRAFAAVKLDQAVELAIAAAMAELRAELTGVKWVAPENIHVTVKFYGDVDADRLPSLVQALGEVAGSHAAFDLAVRRAGTFPDPRKARVLWLGLEDAAGALPALAGAVEAASEPLGFAREQRPFRAHLTIGRARPEQPIRLPPGTLDRFRDADFGTSHISELVLYRSDLRPTGPIYTILHAFPLAPALVG